MSNKKVMITLGGGGHLWESRSLIRQLARDYSVVFITSRDSSLPKGDEFRPECAYRLTDVASLARHGMLHRVSNVVRGVLEARAALREARPDVVIGVGTALSVPLLIAARLMGIPGVFIESITRVDGLSQSGRIIRTLGLARLIYVQWPDAADESAGITYAGTVL